MTFDPSSYDFDSFLRYDELTSWLRHITDSAPGLVEMDSYGTSHEGRNLWLLTITDSTSGRHDHKPAHWVDASIHSVELTACVAACHLIHHLVAGHAAGDERIVDALKRRTFYIVPRVNPDGSEWALADVPRFRRSSTRPWPWTDGHRWPGLEIGDIDGDGRVLDMRIPDPDGAWIPHPEAPRLLVPAPPEGPTPGTPRYRMVSESTGHDLDGFTLPTPPPVEGLDLNRNYPAGWSRRVGTGGDHPMSEPEIDALVRAITARPNICGVNSFHTSGGVLLRPSSTEADSSLPPFDLWAWKKFGEKGTELTGYTVHSVYEDFTWDKNDVMSGASDDWAYQHLGLFGWTTEFWDVVHAATGTKQDTHFWYTGPTEAELLAVLRWVEANDPDGYVDWYPFEHPELGPVELGGWNNLRVWTNPPPSHLRSEATTGHAEFAVYQALCAPELAIRHTAVEQLGPDQWEVAVGVANVGWLSTTVSAKAKADDIVVPITVEISGDLRTRGPSRVRVGQLDGRAGVAFNAGHDGTPDRVLHRFVVEAPAGTTANIVATHPRAGTVSARIDLR